MCELKKNQSAKCLEIKKTVLEISESYKAIAVNNVQVRAFNVNLVFSCIKKTM